MPHHPEIVVKLPDETEDLLIVSAMVGGTIRRRCGNDEARRYYLDALWAKNWSTFVELVKRWVTITP